jgi:hypothetical protein
MPDKKEKRPFYNITFKIGDKDLSHTLKELTILNSINFHCQNFIIKFEFNERDLIQNNITGQETVKLRIEKMQDQNPNEQHDFELNILKIDNSAAKPRGKDETPPPNAGIVTLYCVIKPVWECLTSPTNYFSKNTKKESPFDVSKTIIEKSLKKAKKVIDSRGANNKTKVEQIILPPMNLSRSLDYLDEKYGIYEGITFYTSYFEDKEVIFLMCDLGKRFKGFPIYTILVIPPGTPVPKEAYSIVGLLDNFYYTFIPSEKKMTGNVSTTRVGGSSVFVAKDSKSFFKKVETKAEEIFKKILPKTKGEFKPDEVAKKTKTFNSDTFAATGDNKAAATSKIAKNMFEQFMLTVKMNGVLKLKNLMKVGYPVLYVELTDEGKEISGFYLIRDSAITIKKDSGLFTCAVEVKLVRSDVLSAK